MKLAILKKERIELYPWHLFRKMHCAPLLSTLLSVKVVVVIKHELHNSNSNITAQTT